MKKKIYYWSPALVDIATNRAVINSAFSFIKFNENYETYIINFFGEFNKYSEEINKKKIKLINSSFSSFIKYLPRHGKIRSRISFVVIFILSFFLLKKKIRKDKPNYLIIHLITSLPLTLLLFNNFKTKFILRISGFPKLNFIRKFFWKIALKKISYVTCPTEKTLNLIKSQNLLDTNKIKLLFDPVVDIKKINLKIKEKNILDTKQYFLAAGRLTKQKNFSFLVKNFKNVLDKYPNEKLFIAGEGEDKNELEDFIIKNQLQNKIILLGYVENIFPLMRDAKAFLLTSLWEDPGFVILEAAFCRLLTISSNCNSGPLELIKNKHNGLLFESNNNESFIKTFHFFMKTKKNEKNYYIKNNLKLVSRFTLFKHFLQFEKILNS